MLTGTFTLQHAIDDASPLHDVYFVSDDEVRNREALCDASFGLTVTFVGHDAVYHDDLVAIRAELESSTTLGVEG